MTTPPGWYPDPGHSADGQALERYWDGNRWTEYTRASPAGGFPVPPPPVGEAFGGKAPGRRGKLAAGIVAAVVVVAGIVGGVIALAGSGAGPGRAAGGSSAPTATPPAAPFGGGRGEGGPQGAPPGVPSGAPTTAAPDPGYVLDSLDGIELPVPDGWTGGQDKYGLADLYVGEYPCPGDSAQRCVRGGVDSYPAAAWNLTSTTAEGAAKEDIAHNAAASYGEDVYGGVASHREVRAQGVTVAGEQGYLVRWKVVTRSGTEGYVQSLVFPSPGDSSRLVLVRFGFDIDAAAPQPSVMDQITRGIKAAGSSHGTGI